MQENIEKPDAVRLIIVGGGTAGWMTAAACARFLEHGYEITLVESDDIGTVGVGEATIPQINLFNQALGIDENAFLRATQGTYKLGIEFVDWFAPGQKYMHAFGDVGRDIGLVPFQHYWLRARELGVAKHLGAYSLNETAARALKMQKGAARTAQTLPNIYHAFHFDAGLYAQFLRKYAEIRSVTRVEGKIVHVDIDAHEGSVQGLKLENGQTISGDIFIDCSGFRGLLIEQALHTGYESWAQWLPCDRAVAVPCAHGGEFTPYTRATARRSGWQWRIPLQHRIGNGHVYASAFCDDDEARDILMQNIDGAPLAEPRVLHFVAGKRKKFWNKNVIAIGLASGFLEPLESTSIHLIQSAISRLMSLLPGKMPNAEAVAEYNRQADFEMERIRDFIILHYKATNRRDSPFWQACADMVVPDTLAQKMDLFRASARIYRAHEELFTEVAWLQVMVGQSIIPQSYHPLAAQVSAKDLAEYMETLELLYAREVKQMPSHQEFIEKNCAARQEAA